MQISLPAAPSPATHVPSVRLLYGDCLDLMPTIKARSVAMVFADLPYAVGKIRHTEHTWDVDFNLEALWHVLSGVSLENCIYIFSASQPFTTHLINSNRNSFKYTLVWNKGVAGGFTYAKKRPMKTHEDIVIFANGKTKYNPQMTERDKPVTTRQRKTGSLSSTLRNIKPGFIGQTLTKKYPVSIIHASSRVDKRGLHPTQKPIALLEWLILTYTDEGDTILDPTSGSATAAIAALRTGRNVICIEKDPTYFDVGRQRVAAEQARLGHPVTV